MASNHDSELTKNLLNCPWGAHFADEFNLNIVEENGFSPSSESSFEPEKSSRQELFQLSPYIDECVLVKCKLKICRKFVKAQHLKSHVTDYHRLSVEEYKQITNLDGHSKTTNNLDDEDDLIKMLNNFESDQIKINSETEQFKANIFRNYEKNCINSNGIVPLNRFVDNCKRPLVNSTQSTAKKKVKLNPDQEHRWVRIRSPPTMAGIIQAQRQQGLTYSIIRKFRKSPVASMHGSLQLKRHRLVYPSYRIQQKQMVDVIKHRNSFFQNADGSRRSSVSSSKNKTPVHPIHLFTREAKPSDNHNLESISNPLTYSKILCYRRENCRRNSSSDKPNTSPPHYLSNKVPDEMVTENSECPVLRMKSLGLQRPVTAESDVDACSSSTTSSNVITDEDRSSSLEERRQSEEDVTSDSDAKCSSDDETSGTSSSPSEDEQDQKKDVSFLDKREEHPEIFSKEKCFSGPNSNSPTPKECEIGSLNFLGVKKGSSSSDSCSSAESSVEDSENEDLSSEDDDEEEEMSEDDDNQEEEEVSDGDEVEKEEMSDEEENEVKKEEIFNKEDEMENKQVFSKEFEVSDDKSDEEEEVFKDYNDNWWDRRSSLTSAGSNISINWCKNSKFNLVSFKPPPTKFDRIQPVNNIKLKITHTSNMSNKSVGTMLSEKEESNFDFEGKVLVARARSLGTDKSTDNPEEDLRPDDHRNISPTPKESSENSVKNSAAPITPNKEQPDLGKNRNRNSNPSVSTTPVEPQPQKKLNTDKSDSTSVINRKFSFKNNYLKFNRPRTLFSSLKQQDKSRDEMLRKVKLPDADKEPFKQPILSPISFPNQSAIQQTSVPKPNNIHTVQAVKTLVQTTNGNIDKCDKIANLVTRKHPQVNGIKLNENHLKPEYINAIVSSCIDGRKHPKGDSCRNEAESEIILGIKKRPFIDPSISSTKLPLENSFSKIRKDSSNVTIHNEDNKDKQYLNSGPVIQNGY